MISVCIATYNGSKYISKQIASILNQLSESDEIIISDDGSKDDTMKIISDFHDKRIKEFKNEGLHGIVLTSKTLCAMQRATSSSSLTKMTFGRKTRWR